MLSAVKAVPSMAFASEFYPYASSNSTVPSEQENPFANENIVVGTLTEVTRYWKRAKGSIDIYGGKEVFIGRDPEKCGYVLEDAHISSKHLRIYTIQYDEQTPPLVYVQNVSENKAKWNGYYMERGSAFLLSHGDRLKLPSGISFKYTSETEYYRPVLNLHLAERQVLEPYYTVTRRLLGSGGFGQVFMAYNTATGQQLACKVINISSERDSIVENLRQNVPRFFKHHGINPSYALAKSLEAWTEQKVQAQIATYDLEARILKEINHPNIIGMERVIWSRNTLYIFEDLIPAGDLHSYIEYRGGRLSQMEAMVIIRQLIIAVDYLHDRNIVHRDLKPENILMTSLLPGHRVVITDFGAAVVKSGPMSDITGTIGYRAPEIEKQRPEGYTKAVDLWSLGSIAFMLLTGYGYDPALSDQQIDEVFDQVNINFYARDFVRGLLMLDDRDRMDAKQALAHEWFTNPITGPALEDEYQRAIADWKPRVREGRRFILGIDELMRGRHLPRGIRSPSTSPERLDLQFSQTLSDINLPPHHQKDPLNLSQEQYDGLEYYIENLISPGTEGNAEYYIGNWISTAAEGNAGTMDHYEDCNCPYC